MRSKIIGIIAAIVIGVAAVAGGIYVAMSLEKVGQGEVGVVYTMKNGVQEETLGPGWHFVGPFAKVKNYPVAQQQLLTQPIGVVDFSSFGAAKEYMEYDQNLKNYNYYEMLKVELMSIEKKLKAAGIRTNPVKY